MLICYSSSRKNYQKKKIVTKNGYIVTKIKGVELLVEPVSRSLFVSVKLSSAAVTNNTSQPQFLAM